LSYLTGGKLFLAAIGVILALTSCSSDPFQNAGSCNAFGESKIVDEKTQVCIGLDNNLKWYLDGKYYNDFKLLGKITYHHRELAEYSDLETLASKLGLQGYLYLYDETTVTQDDIAKYAEGDTRWDGLIEAITNLDREQATQNYLMQERFRLIDASRAGKVSDQVAYEAQQTQINHMNGDLDKAKSIYEQKISVLAADINLKYGIVNRTDAVLFVIRILKF